VTAATRHLAVSAGSRRHHLTILICDLSNSTRIAASMEPELYAELLQHLRDMLEETVARHGGEIVRIDGDGSICIFGYPIVHEDAGRRATEAAIDLHAAARRLDRQFAAVGATISLHSGIHAGVVLLRKGDLVRGRFEMLGDATNVAARLCDHAGRDEIIVSEVTLGADRYFFRSAPASQVTIAGHPEPLDVLKIYGREAATTRFGARTRLGATPFVGRGDELARLRSWVAHDRSGLVAVTGPSGIGKTRLVSEVIGEAPTLGVSVHRGYCEAYLGARPLQPFTQLMRSMTAADAHDLADTAGERAGKAAAGLPLEGAVAEMRAAIEAVLRDGPVILVVDDWQWADDASRGMLEALVQEGRVGFLIASRSPDLRLGPLRETLSIAIPPLSADEARAAITALLPTPDQFVARMIREGSGGNPLFLEELCHASRRRPARVESIESNAWLDMLIQARFTDLPDEQAALLRCAAVIGSMVPSWLLAAVAGGNPDDRALAELAKADFLFPSGIHGTMRFKHGIARDAIYRAIDLREREDLHRRAAQALTGEAERKGDQSLTEALAYHCAASGDIARAVPLAVSAGDLALAAGALDRAQAHYREAFEMVVAQRDERALADWIWPLVNKYGLACIVDPAPGQICVIREMAARLRTLGDARSQVRSDYWIGAIAYGLGESKQSVSHLTSALRSARAMAQTHFIPQIEIKLAQSLFAAGRYDEATALFTRLLSSPHRQSGFDEETRIYALCCHGFLYADRGDFASSRRRYAEADSVRGSSAPPLVASYLTQKSAVCLFRGEWEEALAYAHRCLDACRRSRTRYQAIMSAVLAACAQWQLDRDPNAVETLVGAARWFASGTSQQRTSLLYGWLAEIMVENDRRDLARHFAARAFARVRRAGDRLGEAMAYRALARLAAAEGDAPRAAYLLGRAYRSAAIRGSSREEAQTQFCEGELALAKSERAKAEQLIGAARLAFEAMDMSAFAERASRLLTASR
jgi:class 3 adenylate cyclase/tetratricopeptide (TPR) repeat protein